MKISMNKMWLITQRELFSYVNTWTGYLIIAVTLLLDGLLFHAFALGSQPKLSTDVLTDFFYFSSGISMVAGILLAMKLIAEEKQTGTIVVLYTSPVSERSIIYGKFLAALLFSFALHLMSLYLPLLIFVHGKISLGHLAVGYLSLVLLTATTMSITTFASSLASNQLIAVVLGGVMTVLLLILWLVADVVGEPFKSVLSFLAIHNKHFVSFSKGIFNLSDFIFYVSLVLFFLECSTQVLCHRRNRGAS